MMLMSSADLYSGCAILLFTIGLLGFLLNSDFIRKLLGLNVIGMAIFMFLIAVSNSYDNAVDPIPHAMVLTGIVIAAAGTALGLNLASKVVRLTQDQKGSSGGE